MENVQVRASSLPGLFDCPARFEATQIKGLRMPTSGKAVLGRAVHASTAAYDLARLNGNCDLTADEAAGAAVDAIHQPDEEVAWDEDLMPKTAEKIALGLHDLYCANISPVMDYAAVEVTCEPLLVEDLGLILTGTVDRVYKTNDGQIGIADIKTGGSAVAADGTVKTAGHAFQIGIYELLAGAAAGRPVDAPAQIVGLQTGKTAKGQRAGLGKIEGARAALVGDEESPGALAMAARIIHHGYFHGNPKSMMCHQKYCPLFGQCRYRA